MKKIFTLFFALLSLSVSFASAYYTYPTYPQYGYTNVNSVTVTESYTVGCTTYYYDTRTGASLSTKNICSTYVAPATYYYPSYTTYGNANYTDYSVFTGYNNSYDAIIDGTYCNYGYNCANRAITSYPQYNYQAWGYQNSCYSYYDTYYGYYRSSCGY